ncbi:hypothetical protein MED01_003323 [Micromonospora sp. MED01]|uniref:hypothetical protein n=1 Tax=Micromonospora alfalfae TaxID=2911212 RepID=UPI001EE85EBC|nr:hypothetical protein [Micromonospora alfalfae]MCG5465053.1 hypothetical protein [Micromonospora alfalfae]
MRGFNGTATAKVLILAAIPIGGVGFFVAKPWAVAAIVANLLLLAGGGALWWLDFHRKRRWLGLRRSGVPGTLTPGSGVTTPSADYCGEVPPVFVEQRRRHRLMLSATSRVRRSGGRRHLAGEPSPDADQLTMVAAKVAQIQHLIDTGQQRSRREQLWWLVAGLAASVPIGVAINLVTG